MEIVRENIARYIMKNLDGKIGFIFPEDNGQEAVGGLYTDTETDVAYNIKQGTRRSRKYFLDTDFMQAETDLSYAEIMKILNSFEENGLITMNFICNDSYDLEIEIKDHRVFDTIAKHYTNYDLNIYRAVKEKIFDLHDATGKPVKEILIPLDEICDSYHSYDKAYESVYKLVNRGWLEVIEYNDDTADITLTHDNYFEEPA